MLPTLRRGAHCRAALRQGLIAFSLVFVLVFHLHLFCLHTPGILCDRVPSLRSVPTVADLQWSYRMTVIDSLGILAEQLCCYPAIKAWFLRSTHSLFVDLILSQDAHVYPRSALCRCTDSICCMLWSSCH
jgi:hypothetical protein